MKLDEWQEEVMETKGNMVLRSGRQVGKSTIIGLKAAKYALEHQKKLIMVISKTERQAGLLFQKILLNIHEIDKTQIKKGKDRPTKHLINLKNGSKIFSLPAGDTGYGIMGYTINLLIADEAAFVPEEVWNSIIPSLAVSRGNIWLLSTPFIKEGYYYNCFKDPTFTAFHQSSEDCPRKDQQFLDHQKEILSKANYAQMYLGEFRDEIKQFFSDELIFRTCTLSRRSSNVRGCSSDFPGGRGIFLGVDIARMGEDESTFEIIEQKGKMLTHIENLITRKTLTTETEDKILELDEIYNFDKIYIDAGSGSLGVGIFDHLLANEQTKRKVVAINNRGRPLDRDGKSTRLLKEDLYDNLLMLMERKQISLLDDDEVKTSLKSIQYEYVMAQGQPTRMRITGNYSHIVEGLIRAAFCVKDKSLNIWVSGIKV